MKRLSLSRDGSRLLLVIPDQLPLRAAARAVRGCRYEGTSIDLATFSYPAAPDVCAAVMDTFEPQVANEASPAVVDLMAQKAALDGAVAGKDQDRQLLFDPRLCSTPMQHQVRALNFCATRTQAGAPGSALLMEQGTGKSLVAIGMANWLHAQGHISWALVMCPNSLKGTWAADDGEVLKHSLPGARVRTLRGSRDKRQDYLRRLVQPSISTDLLWVVTNYDEFAVNIQKHGRDAERFQGTLDIVRAARPGILIADESTAVKNPNARRTRAVLKLAALFPYRMILTGTPVECSPLDLWSQFEVLQRGCLGFNSALAFEKSYAVHQRISIPKAGGGRRSVVTVTGYKNLTDLERRVAQVSFRVRAKDCLDLPPVTVRTLPVDLSAQQGRLLRELKSDMMAELGTALIDGRNILTRYQKMAQVVSGWVKVLDQDGVTTRWEALNPNPKLAALEEYLELAMEDPARKVVVFAEHPATEIAAIEALCKRHGWGPVSFYGDVTEVERDRRRQLFTKVPDCRVFIAQYECGSKGLNLTAADTVVFYGLTFKYGTWSQARKRVDRKGQERPVTEVYLIGMAPPAKGTRMKRTLDHIQLEALRNKQNLADVVTGDHARRILEAL